MRFAKARSNFSSSQRNHVQNPRLMIRVLNSGPWQAAAMSCKTRLAWLQASFAWICLPVHELPATKGLAGSINSPTPGRFDGVRRGLNADAVRGDALKRRSVPEYRWNCFSRASGNRKGLLSLGRLSRWKIWEPDLRGKNHLVLNVSVQFSGDGFLGRGHLIQPIHQHPGVVPPPWTDGTLRRTCYF